MKLFDRTFSTPAENLACDEALLDWREENCGTGFQPVSSDEGILRFWESPEAFVVAGYANKITTEVNIVNCQAKQISIFRRCSGGGTVLQGRGCLNYALILRIAENSPFASISSANQFIMEHNRKAIQSAIGNRQSAISICGHTDLVIGGKKFSGNSQRRHKKFLLFHGTFLLDFNLALIGEFLRMPSKQPDYRGDRSHKDFLTNLNLTADEVKTVLKKVWNVTGELKNPPIAESKKLAAEKYSSREWNFKF